MLLQKELSIILCRAAATTFISVDSFQDLKAVTGNKTSGFWQYGLLSGAIKSWVPNYFHICSGWHVVHSRSYTALSMHPSRFNPYLSIAHPPSVFGCEVMCPFMDFMDLNFYIYSTCWLIFGCLLNVFVLTNSQESWLLNEILCKYSSAFLLDLLTFGKEEYRKCPS